MTQQLESAIRESLAVNDIPTLKHLMKCMTEAEHMAAAKTLSKLATKQFGWS